VTSIESWLLSVLGEIRAHCHDDFSGIGLVFYTDRKSLPVHPLVPHRDEPKLPVRTVQASIELFTSIARRTSIYHDGFHLIDAKTLSITDVSQFLSPPIPEEPLVLERHGGARHMAARLGSLLSSVPLTAVWTAGDDATLYERGIERPLRIPPRND
jgi:hypothetical protein